MTTRRTLQGFPGRVPGKYLSTDTVSGLKSLKEEHARSVSPLHALAAEARQLEGTVADLVNAAYGLTADEVDLMWKTAPPRMPGARPLG